ncbi:MAG TPA: aromatic acid decarboxylase [Paenibacillaceae bacterium]|mgnify:CR=1 FL=1|nr:aromatic acid decarboxylase [Paenibacillaceae bacterium]
MKKRYTVGITGASGSIYGIRLVEELVKLGHEVHLVITEAGWQVFQEELNWNVDDRESFLYNYFSSYAEELHVHSLHDYKASIASGSYRSHAMVVVPCSMGTLSGIATGASGNLLERTADVMLKEGNMLVLVPRESPFNAIHLENMLKLAKLGVRILPAMPGFYHKPQTIDDLINFVVGKIMDTLGEPHNLFRRWGE